MLCLLVLLHGGNGCGPARPASAPPAERATASAPEELVFRETSVGKIVQPRRTTWTLALSVSSAQLDRTNESAPATIATTTAYAWKAGMTARWDGKLTKAAGRLELELARFCQSEPDCTPRLVLSCAWEMVDVRGADAGFVDGDACEGDGPPPRETNIATTKVKLLRCRRQGEADERTLDFGPTPGVERYDQNDDCAGQFHTLRRMKN
jgi:hypothetical protein